MSMSTIAYARCAFKSFSRSARHILQLIASHQSLQTGWAYVGYRCLADESSLTPRRVIQLVALLEANHALEVRRGHGRGHVNFYRVLREEDGLPVPQHSLKKVKFPTPPPAEKVKSQTPNPLESFINMPDKDIEIKERKERGAASAFVSLS
jgi:hypothetical protein